MKRYFTGIVASLLMYTTAFAQYEVKGKIIDAQTKEALSAVSIHISHTSIGTASNLKGDFKLSAPIPIDTLIVSFTGYNAKTVTVRKNNLIVSLNSSATVLNGVIVSASREAENRSDAPIAISTISPQTIGETKATTLDQLMNTVSGVYMVDLGNEQHTMAIRQPIGYRNTFLYLEDGIPIRATGDFNHNALIEINAAALKRIEVIKGPSSSLYGSDAIGGAVNFITQSPSAIPTAKLQVEGSDWGYKRTDFSVSNTINKTGFYLGGYYASQHGGYMQHSDFNKLALTLRADHQINDQSKITTEATLINYKT
ncbi:MAG TPA: TonB-dependent receptor, partial [Chitinophagaceae bacterium]